jgi:hypothetical protein
MAITISGDSPNLTSAAIASPVFSGTPTGVGVLTSGTAVASTSGTSIDFTSIPSWVKRITVMFNEVSTNGSSNYLVQIGDAGGFEITGYKSNCQVGASGTSSTTGFMILNSVIAGTTASGTCVLTLLNANSFLWTHQAILSGTNGTNVYQSSGAKPLSDTLTQVRITAVNGTDTFDAGSINILYE